MSLNPQITGKVGLYYCCYKLNKVASSTPQAFILLPAEVKTLAHRDEKGDRVSFWLQPNDYEQTQFREAWERIGHGGLDAQPVNPAHA